MTGGRFVAWGILVVIAALGVSLTFAGKLSALSVAAVAVLVVVVVMVYVGDSRRPCSLCEDTGVIDTGNNALPCQCPAGGVALFNVSTPEGTKTLRGDELDRLRGRRR